MVKKIIRKRKFKRNAYAIIEDLLMISIGILIAVFISKTGILDLALSSINDHYVLSSFIAGIFFTSAFTIAPASIALVHIAQNSPIMLDVIIWGGIGAMCGDLLLLFFIKDRFAKDVIGLIKPSKVKYLMKSLHFGFLKWLSPLLGALIIASPLPDEFAITLLGMSKVRLIVIIPLSIVMNMTGIYLLIQFSNLL